MTQCPPSVIDMAALMRRLDEDQARARKVVEPNKRALFAALAAAGISGQIEDIKVLSGENETNLPDGEVTLSRLQYGSDDAEPATLPIMEAVEGLCYALLGQEHGGWENNEGGYGEFIFDVAANTIELDMNIRIETSEYHGHQW